MAVIKGGLSLYSSEAFNANPPTWDRIKALLLRYNYAERLEQAKVRLAAIDGEIPRLREILATLKNAQFLCFDLFNPILEVENALTNAERDEVLV